MVCGESKLRILIKTCIYQVVSLRTELFSVKFLGSIISTVGLLKSTFSFWSLTNSDSTSVEWLSISLLYSDLLEFSRA